MIYSHTVPWEQPNLPAFLRRAAGQPRFFWESERAAVSFSAFGTARLLSASGPDRFRRMAAEADEVLSGAIVTREDRVPEEAARPRFVGGFPFLAEPPDRRSRSRGVWRRFGQASFTLPRYLLSRWAGDSYLTVSVVAGLEDPWAAREALWELPAPLDIPVLDFSPTTVSPEDLTSRESWERSVCAAVAEVRAGRLGKVVLARAREFPAGANPVASLARLSATYPGCFRFLIEPEPGHAFFGASPELLVSRKGREVATMALAGSIRRGRSLVEDEQLAGQLFASDKDRVEHELVLRSVQERMQPVLGRIEILDRDLLRLSNIQHLCTPILGESREGAGLLDIVERLHPTPAVGGLPVDEALAFIAAVEPVTRGWYAGPVGWFDGAGDGEFAVALRSAVSDGARTRLYAGAGIVGESEPDREWDEIELKFRPMMEALGCLPDLQGEHA
jgi:menaquinone-specific isochorismate synthase